MPAPMSDADRRRHLMRLAVLYRIHRNGEQLGIIADTDDQKWIEPLLSEMDVEDLLDPDEGGEFLRLTDHGREVLGRLAAMFDRVQQFQIFARVYLFVDPATKLDGKGLVVAEADGTVFWDAHDPRFGDPDEPTSDDCVDMRLAMLAFLAETCPDGPQEFDPHVLVFLEMLAMGEFNSPTFWQGMRTGSIFRRIDEIVKTAKTWQSVADDEVAATETMRGLYEIGLVELQKREGRHCPTCGGALALHDEEARAEGTTMTHCPIGSCGAEFPSTVDPDVAGDCPACGAEIRHGQTRCSCGARINYALPPGTIRTSGETTVETVTEVWETGYDYGYTPVGYYDPWGPPVGLFATGFVLGAILF